MTKIREMAIDLLWIIACASGVLIFLGVIVGVFTGLYFASTQPVPNRITIQECLDKHGMAVISPYNNLIECRLIPPQLQ